MPEYVPTVLLLSLCWIASLAILFIFTESWFGVSSGRERFVARRASGSYGICSVFVILRGPVEKVERTVRSVFGQSYPFLEVFLIYPEENVRHAALAQEFLAARTHVAVRLVAAPHSVNNAHDRIRALEAAQPLAKGRWYVVLDPEVVLDRFAIEGSMEFAGGGELSALALRPGTQASSLAHRILAPSMGYLAQMMQVVERRRERPSSKMGLDAPYLLFNRDSFELLHRINHMPGILNESGWSLWSYRVEGLRTFDGEGSRWVWREVDFDTWPDRPNPDRKTMAHSPAFIAAATLLSLIPAAGLAYGFAYPVTTFPEQSILALSAVSYTLMAISYYLSARRLRAAVWFAPFWFVAQPAAAVLAWLHVRRREARMGRRRTDMARTVRPRNPESRTSRRS